jgi:hypothetical protein
VEANKNLGGVSPFVDRVDLRKGTGIVEDERDGIPLGNGTRGKGRDMGSVRRADDERGGEIMCGEIITGVIEGGGNGGRGSEDVLIVMVGN